MNIAKLPKIELHCHLDGSIRPKTIAELGKLYKVALPSYNEKELTKLLNFKTTCALNVKTHINKFEIPVSVMQTQEALFRVAYELTEDAAKDNIKYLEIRFAPRLHTKGGLNYRQIIQAVITGAKVAEANFVIKTNIILCFRRSADPTGIIPVLDAGIEFLNKGVVAVDLVGFESVGFAVKFIKAMTYAKKLGFKITIHAGEMALGNNVSDAINLLKAERIGHGFRVQDDPIQYALVKASKIPLELCLTSNLKHLNQIASNHPIKRFLDDGLIVTLSTDNRTISKITLTNEITYFFNNFDISLKDYRKLYQHSITAAFADEKTKEWLKVFINDI